jgi:hypothetical protein
MALMKSKTVSFNIENETEKTLHDWAVGQKEAFSSYIKRLIAEDMRFKNRPVHEFRVPK